MKSSAKVLAKSSKQEEEDSFNCSTEKVKTKKGLIMMDEVITEGDKDNM